MRLYYHADSDALFLSETWPDDGQCEDVSDDPAFRVAAKLRGLKFELSPEVTSMPSFSNAIIESYRRWDRKEADLYPTPVNGTESVVPVLKVWQEKFGVQRLWEPCCGDGRMSRVLEWHGFEVLSTDLRAHPGYGIPNFDFLISHRKAYGWDPANDIDGIVMNPPFSKAEEFITKALRITPYVAVLLKQTYWNAASRLPFFRKHVPKMVLPLTFRLAFLEAERGKSPLMDCCWVIWHPGEEDYCVFEPIPRRVYPGYHGPGLRSAMASLEEALLDLTETVHAATPA